MSTVLEVTRQDISSNGVEIEKAGKATFSRGQYCRWRTALGTISSVTVANHSDKVLTLVITGAPDTVLDQKKRPLNGYWEIPRKSANERIVAVADFQGTTVLILNNSEDKAECEVIAQTNL
jgi:hypothetical protein